MRRNQILDTLQKQFSVIKDRFGVRHLAIFGSVARDAAGPESDIDVLVEFEGQADFDRFMDLKFFLEELFHKRVDLVTQGGLRPHFDELIKKELIRVA